LFEIRWVNNCSWERVASEVQRVRENEIVHVGEKRSLETEE
jgi:hypothetical protein